jgi:hypothetical protein
MTTAANGKRLAGLKLSQPPVWGFHLGKAFEGGLLKAVYRVYLLSTPVASCLMGELSSAPKGHLFERLVLPGVLQ